MGLNPCLTKWQGGLRYGFPARDRGRVEPLALKYFRNRKHLHSPVQHVVHIQIAGFSHLTMEIRRLSRVKIIHNNQAGHKSIFTLQYATEITYQALVHNAAVMTKNKLPPFRPSKWPQTFSSPEELFAKLPNRAATHGYLRGPQQEVLRAYIESGDEVRNVALELPTGTGKTTVGLLIADRRCR